MPSTDLTPEQLLAAAQERAARLCESLSVCASNLAASEFPDPATRDEGLTAIRQVLSCAQKLATDAQAAGASSAEALSPSDSLAKGSTR